MEDTMHFMASCAHNGRDLLICTLKALKTLITSTPHNPFFNGMINGSLEHL